MTETYPMHRITPGICTVNVRLWPDPVRLHVERLTVIYNYRGDDGLRDLPDQNLPMNGADWAYFVFECSLKWRSNHVSEALAAYSDARLRVLAWLDLHLYEPLRYGESDGTYERFMIGTAWRSHVLRYFLSRQEGS